MNKKIRTIDLTNSNVVLGSGPNALATIHGLLESNKEISVIDAGQTEKDSMTEENELNKKSSPKFYSNHNHYIYEGFNNYMDINLKNFNLTGSLAKGGLSNIWGGGIQPYISNDLELFPYSFDEIRILYSKIFEIISGSNDASSLEDELVKSINHRKEASKTLFLKSLIAFNKQQSKHNSCDLLFTCNNGCANCNKGIFNSKYEIESLIKKNKIHYFKNMLIKNIYKFNNFYEVHCEDIKDGTKYIFKTLNIFSSLGTISTTKIVLEMENKNNELRLLSTPMSRFILFGRSRSEKQQTSIMQGVTYKLFNNDYLTGNIFPITSNLVESVIGSSKYRIFKYFMKYAHYFYVGNLFFTSDYSSNVISLIDKKIHIKSETSQKLKAEYLLTMTKLKKDLKKEGYFLLPLFKKLLKPGDDIHYGGTLPIKKNPGPYQCDSNGELYGNKNFFITDASSMPFLPSKPHTFHSMCQSFMIAKNFAKKT